MTIDLQSFIAGTGFTLIAGWLTAFFALRKDERAIHIEQVTKERAKWRDNMRTLTEEIVTIFFLKEDKNNKGRISALRSRLTTSINPKDDTHDQAILDHFDRLFDGNGTDTHVFTQRIALLLKHDWERVKWECMPIYEKLFKYRSKKQQLWRRPDYRDIPRNTCLKHAANKSEE